MNTPEINHVLNRRKFLQSGGLALASAAILAACGKSDKVATTYPRIGDSPTTTALPDGTVNDVVLLRTASSLEWCAIDAYTAAAGLGLLPAAATSVVKRFQADHKAPGTAAGFALPVVSLVEGAMPLPSGRIACARTAAWRASSWPMVIAAARNAGCEIIET